MQATLHPRTETPVKEAFALTASLAFIVTGAIVGARMLLMARRTRQSAELFLGIALFSIAGLAYPVLIAGTELDSFAKRALSAAGAALLCLGWTCFWLFTWTTFRREAPWARALTLAAIAASVAISCWRIVRIFAADAESLRHPTVDALGTQILAMGVYAWTSIEAFRYRAMLAKRVRLGLADPTVADRFRLWGLLGVFSFASLVLPVASAFQRTPEMATLSRLAVGITGTGCSAALYLAFLPPKRYLDRVRRRAAAAAA
jgi:hypothetical protein